MYVLELGSVDLIKGPNTPNKVHCAMWVEGLAQVESRVNHSAKRDDGKQHSPSFTLISATSFLQVPKYNVHEVWPSRCIASTTRVQSWRPT